MALKKHETALLDSIKMSATVIAGFVGHDAEKIAEHMKSILDEFSSQTNQKLIISYTDGVLAIDTLDLKQDFIRTRMNPDKSMTTLKAKLFGVAIDVKVAKDEASFSNEQIAESLFELAVIVKGMPVAMRSYGHDDWSRTVGNMPKSISMDDDDAIEGLDVPEEEEEKFELEMKIDTEEASLVSEYVESVESGHEPDVTEQYPADSLLPTEGFISLPDKE
jgi:hypothetical protein